MPIVEISWAHSRLPRKLTGWESHSLDRISRQAKPSPRQADDGDSKMVNVAKVEGCTLCKDQGHI